MTFRSSHYLMVLSWRAKKRKTPVIMVSTECSARMVEVANTTKPSAVHEYNKNMNGVDSTPSLTRSFGKH